MATMDTNLAIASYADDSVLSLSKVTARVYVYPSTWRTRPRKVRRFLLVLTGMIYSKQTVEYEYDDTQRTVRRMK
jgi:hypothetical protein